MTSGGKWPARWVPSRAKTTAEQGPVPRPSVNYRDDYRDDDPDQLPPEVSMAVRDGAVPSRMTAQDMPPAMASAMPPAMPPALAQDMPPGPRHTGQQHPVTRMPAPDMPPAMASAMPPAMAPAQPPGPRHSGGQHPATRQRSHMRAVIGDELRAPALLCEFDGCGARYTHPDALGERELRDRAIVAGWQYDLIGRLACPSCVRHAPTFWARNPQVPAVRGE